MSDKLRQEIKSVLLSLDRGKLKGLPALVKQLCRPEEVFTRLELSDEESARLTFDPDWMAAIYDNLADAYGDEVDEVEAAIDDSHLAPVGQDLVYILLPGLPSQLETLGTLEELPPVSPSTVATLERFSDVRAAGLGVNAVGGRLARRGLRPVMFQQAMDGVATLIDDLIEDKKLKVAKDQPIRLYCRQVDALPTDGIGFQEAAIEVALTTSLDKLPSPEEERKFKRVEDVPIPRSLWLMRWLKDASLSKPLLFPGYRTERDRDDLLLVPTGEPRLPRDERWRTVVSDSAVDRRESYAGGRA